MLASMQPCRQKFCAASRVSSVVLQRVPASAAEVQRARRKSSTAAAGSQVPGADAQEARWEHFSQLSRTEGAAGHANVNRRYVPRRHGPALAAPAADNSSPGTISEKHLREEWSAEEIGEAVNGHVMATWGPGAARKAMPVIVRGEGVYLYDADGHQYMDMTSQAVCMNMGYTVDESMKQAVIKQMETLPFIYSGIGMTQMRAKLASLMAEITPGDLNGFLFPLGGADANEAAIRIARRFSGRYKIMNSLRSYHGGSSGSLAATGDPRRLMTGAAEAGFVKIFNPQAQLFSTGQKDAEAAAFALSMLEEQILNEGPETIAAVMLESIVGAGGVLVPPVGYMEGVRALCDKYDILLILDEVMVGFWRTGPLFAFQHFKGVIPDIVTSAKGLTASFLPLGMVGVRQKIMDHFETNALGWGATYANHPVSLACAYHTIRKNFLGRMHEHVARLEAILLDEVDRFVSEHACVRQGRVVGAFACLDLVKADDEVLSPPGGAMSPEATLMQKTMRSNGLIGFFRPPLLHIAPPLVITEAELQEMLARIRRSLSELDVIIAQSR